MGRTIGLIFALQDKCSPSIKKLADKIGITEKEAKKLHNQIGKLSKELGGNLKKACTVVSAGVVGSIGALSALAVKSSQTCDRIDDLSNKIGISRAGFQEWDYLLGQNGASIESLQMGFKTLVNQINGVTQGNKKSVATFKALGISVKDSSGRLKNQEQVFNEVVSALQRMPEGAKKAKLANDLLGRSGSELMPLFNQNIEIFQKQREEYKKLGIAISDDVIDAGNQFGDSMEKLKSIGAGYGAMIGGQLLPIINQLTGALINELPKIREALTPVFDSLTNSVKFLIENFNTLKWIATICLTTFVAYKAINGVIATIKTLQTVIKAVSVAQGVWNALMIANPIGMIAVGIGLLITGIIALVTHWDAVKKAFMSFYEKIQPALAVIGKWIAIAFSFTPIGMFINGIKLLVENWDKVTESIKKAIDAVKKFVGIKGKTEVKTEDGAVVKKNAVGTSFYSGGKTKINEFGGEIVDLPTGSRIIPHDISKEIVKNNNSGINIQVTVLGNMVGNQEFLNQMANVFAQKLQIAMATR